MGETVKLAEAENKARGGVIGWWKRVDDRAREKHPEWWKLFLWAVMGFVANIPELGTYMGLRYGFRAMGVDNLGIFGFMERIVAPDPDFPLATVVYAYMISTAVGYAIAFVLNRKATFRADSNIALSTFIYVLTVIFTIFANGFIGPIISNLVGMIPVSSVVTEMIAKFLGMLVPGLWFYPMNRFVIHRKKKEAADNV